MESAKRVLAIETSGRHGSVATLLGDACGASLVGQAALSGDQRTAQALAPALTGLLKQADWSPQSIELVAVAIGPGSFTGLRIGVTTAKTLAYAVEAEVLGVNTLLALAAQALVSAAPLWAVFDAQRQELYAARFSADNTGQLCADRDTSIIAQEDWLAELQPGDRVTGTALGRLAARLPAGVEIVSPALWQPMAAAVGQVAWQAYQAGRRGSVWELAPQYYRASAAEEKAARQK
jgi:tRNA threonylcarbamoyladenosine biosynthesis protein TsaB